MSNQAKPFEELDIYNSVNYPSSSAANLLSFPVAQGTETMPYGIIWGDGTYQNSANPGGYSLTVQDGTTTVPNVNNINVTNGTLTNLGGGSVDIQTGGSGGGVTNPMTANLDGGGYDITNVANYSGTNAELNGFLNVREINNSAAVQYVNMGGVTPGNEYVVAEIPLSAVSEGSVTIVSRCLDLGFKQTIVFTATAFRTRGHANVIANLTESDTPIFEALVVGERSGALFCTLRCSAPSNTWEVRAYMNQDNKGTIGSYGSSWRLAPTATVSPGLTTFLELRLGFQNEGMATMSGDLNVTDGIQCRTLACDTASATTSVTTNAVFTNEIRDNGFSPIGIYNSISMQNNDIQSAATVGGTAFVGAALNITIPIGHPTNGPLFVDTQNNRVGINVSAPQEDFEIDGNIQLDSSGANKIKFYDGTATTERAEIDAVASGTGGQLVFYTKEDPGSVTAKMTVQADGRITITNRIEGLTVPVAGTDAANKDYVDASIPSLAGYVQNPMTGNLDAASFKITNLLDPTAAQDVATKAYVDTSIPSLAGYVQNPMTVDLDAGSFKIANLLDPTAAQDAATKSYVDSTVGYTDTQAVNAVQTCATNPVPQLQLSCGFAFAPPVLAPTGGVYVIPQNVSIVHAFGGSTTLQMPSGVREGTVIMIRNENNVTLDVNPGGGQQIENYNLGSPGTPSYIAPSFIGNFQSVTYYLADLGVLTWYVLPRP